jgi:catechol 2,3-dioxygenase-like lactoylglutathione lyase family enzyme
MAGFSVSTKTAQIVAPQGSPLVAAVLGCERLAATRDFYCERLGFDAGPETFWRDPVVQVLTASTAVAGARACLLAASGSAVGRILLLEFVGADGTSISGERIHRSSDSRVVGLSNLNFYTADIAAAARALAAAGYPMWTAPTQHALTATVGTPIEVLFDGPDGVTINLVELTSSDPTLRIGQMRAFVEQHGYTRTGFTPVVTTSHVVRSMPRARGFYERVLKMGALIDEELANPTSNAFLRLPTNSRTHVTFMQGNHMFGKVALSEPLTYLEQCTDLAERAHAPNYGYIAQIFEVDDVASAYWECRAVQAPGLTSVARLPIPGFGVRRGFVARNPGSNALQWIVSRDED